MLAGRTEWREVPHEPGQKIEFRTLSGRELDEAEQEQTKRQMTLAKGWDAETIKTIRAQATDTTVERASKDSYDKDTLIRYGIVAWSDDADCNEQNKALLDAATREWAIDVIVEMNVRPFRSANGSSPS